MNVKRVALTMCAAISAVAALTIALSVSRVDRAAAGDVLSVPGLVQGERGKDEYWPSDTPTRTFLALVSRNHFADIGPINGSWHTQTSGTTATLQAVHFVNSLTGWTVGQQGTILTSHDSGDTWLSQSSGVTNNLQGVDFSDTKTGWAVGGSGTILHTSDDGETWALQNSNTVQNLLAVDFVDNLRGWAAGAFSTILTTQDGGAIWHPQAPPDGYTFLLAPAVDFLDQRRGWIAPWGGEPGGGVLATVDGGLHWVWQPTGGVYYMTGVSFINATEGWAAGYELGDPSCPGVWRYATRVFRSTDAGATWALTGNACGYSKVIDFVDAAHGWLIVADETGTDRILTSGDGGINWSEQYSVTSALNDMQMLSSLDGWAVGADGTILRFVRVP